MALAHLAGGEVQAAEGPVLGRGQRLHAAALVQACDREAFGVDQLDLSADEVVREGQRDWGTGLVETGQRGEGAGDEQLQIVQLARRRTVLGERSEEHTSALQS